MSNPFRRFAEVFSHGGCSRKSPLLEEQLRQEAWTERPQFSASLHRRLCHAMQHAASQTVAAGQHGQHDKRSWIASDRAHVAWGGLGLATVVVLLGWMIFSGPTVARRATDPTTSLATLATLPDEATLQIEQWLVASTTNARWSYLGHDARQVAEWLAEDLPWKIPAWDAEAAQGKSDEL